MTTPEELVSRSPFLRLLPNDLQARVVGQLTEHRYQFGERIVAEGEAADAYYLIADGRARVIKTAPDGGEIALHLLRAGDSFGEIGLLAGGRRTATVRAAGEVLALRLDRTAFEKMLADSPEVRDFVNLQLQHRRLQGFLRQYTEFSGAPFAAMQALLECLAPVSVGKGATVFRQGDVADAIYIIEEGHVRVFADLDGRETNVAYLRAGDFFGELSFMEQTYRSASVQAVSPCRLQKLNADSFADLMERFPTLRQVVEKRVGRYRKQGEARVPLDFWRAVENDAVSPEDTATAAAQVLGEDTHTMTNRNEAMLELRHNRSQPFSKRDFVALPDHQDSAPACLSMIARHFNRDISLAYIRELMTPTTQNHVSTQDICRAAAESGLIARPVKKSPQLLEQVQLPMIIQFEDQKWVLLTEAEPNRMMIADPTGGMEWMERETFTAHWQGYGVVFSNPDIISQASPSMGRASQWLMPFLQPQKAALSLAVFVTLMMSCCLLVMAMLTKGLLNGAANTEYPTADLKMLSAMAFLLIGIIVMMTLQRRLLTRLANTIDHEVLTAILDKILSLPIPFFQPKRQADLLHGLESVRNLRLPLINHSIGGILAAVQLVVLAIGMHMFSQAMGLAFLIVMVPIYLLLLAASSKILRQSFDRLDEADSDITQIQSEMVGGIEAMKFAGAESRFRNLFHARLEHINRRLVDSVYTLHIFEGSVGALWLLSLVALAGLGLRLVASEDITIGDFFAVQLLAALCYPPCQTLVRLWVSLQQSTVLQSRLRDLSRSRKEPMPPQQGAQTVRSLSGRLEARHIAYRYPGDNNSDALRELNLKVETGEHLVILGSSGSGKSTLLKCLAALVQPSDGTIFVDDVDMRQVNFDSLRQHIGLVPQVPFIFDGTVVENIALADHQPDMARVQQATRDSGLHELVTGFSRGYDTPIGTNGRHLANGHVNSLSIARTLYQQPDILLLDDATGDLDIETEQRVWGSLRERYRGRTLILATSHLHVARLADRVCVMDGGQIVEVGTHDHLMSLGGIYYHMWSRLGLGA